MTTITPTDGVIGSHIDHLKQAEDEHQAFERDARSALEHALQSGAALAKAKAKVPHGQWIPLLEKHTTISNRTAQRYMRLARNKPKLGANATRVSDLSIREALASISSQQQRIARLPSTIVDDAIEQEDDDTRLKGVLKRAENRQSFIAAREREDKELERRKSSAPPPGVMPAVADPDQWWNSLTDMEKYFVGTAEVIIRALYEKEGCPPSRIAELFNEAGSMSLGEEWDQ